MTQLTHPKLTDRVLETFAELHGKDKRKARVWLGKVLDVGKTQSYDWAAKITKEKELDHSDVPYVSPVSEIAIHREDVVNRNGKLRIPANPNIRRLFWDIETSMTVVYSWKVGFKLNIGPENIIHERKIICIGYKWEGESKVNVLTWDKDQDDKAMLVAFLKIANEADELVAHHGDGFDMPWFRTRCVFHGLQPLPDYKTVDTCAWAKRFFYFQSNKLAYIAPYLGCEGKISTTYGLWKDIVEKKCVIALRKMSEYCGQDVRVLEQVWAKMRLCVKPKTHSGVVQGRDKWTCSHCGSEDVRKSKTKVTAAGTVQHQMQCHGCGGYTSINGAAYEAYKLAKGKAAK